MNVIVLRRRLVYISAMVLIVIPLYFLGNPSVRRQDGTISRGGGTLSQLRDAYNLGQGDLGELDPASESMRLATLGLRGVASTILWQKAEYYKREQYWDRLAATLNQIAVLQPHFIEIWKFQSHNLSYNVSAQFDNYRHRYEWVKKGMDYLVRGSKVNKYRTEMPFELGWFFGNKFGVSDEKIQFRELYRNDDVFHEDIEQKTGLNLTQADGLGPDRKPDNWLSGRLWYERAYDMVDNGSRPAKSTMMFYREGPQWLMKYSEAIQGDGYLDDAARFAWRVAGREWRRFGERPILTSFGDTIYLTEIEKANLEYKEADEAFEAFCGDTFTQMRDDRLAALTEEERVALDLPYAERSFEQVLLAQTAANKISIDPEEIAKQLPADKRVEGMQAAKDLKALRLKISHIEIYRNQINYAYWEQRCIAEQEDAALAARQSMYEADQLLEKGLLDEAFEQYELAWNSWGELFNKHPAMMIDDAADDVIDAIQRYRQLRDEPTLPDDFPLAKFLEFRDAYEEQFADPAMMGVIASWPSRYPGRNFLDEMLAKTASFQQDYIEKFGDPREREQNGDALPIERNELPGQSGPDQAGVPVEPETTTGGGDDDTAAAKGGDDDTAADDGDDQ